jgi:uncharacterized protein YuzE
MKNLDVIEMKKVLGGVDTDENDENIVIEDPEYDAKYVYFKPGKVLKEKP